MALTLAFAEGAILFLAACAWSLLEGRTPVSADAPALLVHAVIFSLCGLFALDFNDLYELRKARRFGQFAARLPQALVLMVLLVGVVQVLVPGLRIGWRAVAETLLLALVPLLALRAALHHILGTHPFSRHVLVLGTTPLAGKVVREMLAEPDLRDVVVGVVDDGSGSFEPALPCLRLGSMEDLGSIIQGFEPDLAVCALAEPHDRFVVRELLGLRARGVPVEDGVVTYERLTGKVAIEYAVPRAVLFSRDFQASWLALAFARGLSLVVAAGALVVLFPLLIPVALLIKLDSDGPMFFVHERLGLGGRPFKLIKFRTMRPGGALSEWAADNEHRTTRVGRWLRRFRIDELPQLLNVLRGDMNLVGPRPHPVSNVELFTENIPYYGLRCSVRPGVTGWAQIRYGYANDLKQETEKMRYDLHYIKHMSLGLDLRILFETVKVVVKGGRSAALSDEPGGRLSPIYFGTAPHPRSARARTRLAEAPQLQPARPRPVPGGAPSSSEDVVSLEERRAQGPRAPSPGVA